MEENNYGMTQAPGQILATDSLRLSDSDACDSFPYRQTGNLLSGLSMI
jgi:hypothetical protein